MRRLYFENGIGIKIITIKTQRYGREKINHLERDRLF